VCAKISLHPFLKVGSARFAKIAKAKIHTWRSRMVPVKTRRQTMRILVIEDEPDLLTSLAQALREEGYAVDTAG